MEAHRENSVTRKEGPGRPDGSEHAGWAWMVCSESYAAEMANLVIGESKL